jgi:leader peptidase (prepilin peptidase) / N-methyltransferase
MLNNIVFVVLALFLAPLVSRTALKFVLYAPSYILFWTENKIYEIIKKPVICNECGFAFSKWGAGFPILGYFTTPKCPQCGKNHHIEFLYFEAIIIVLCLLSVFILNFNIGQVIFAWLVIAIACACAYIDIRDMLIPDLLTYSLIWVGLAASLKHYYITPQQAILGVIFIHLVLVNANSVNKLIFKKDVMCQGDIKYLSGVAACFGFQKSFYVMLAAFVLSSVVQLIRRLFSKGDYKFFNHPIPFAPYVSIFAILMLYVAPYVPAISLLKH